MAAAVVDGRRVHPGRRPRGHPEHRPSRRRCSAPWPGWSTGSDRSAVAAPRHLRCRVWWADAAGRRDGVAAQHQGVAGLPAARSAGRRHRAPGGRRQRRQGAGPRRGLAGRGPGVRQLSGHGGVDRHRRRHRARRPAARRGARATPATSGTWWSSRTGGPASVRRAGLSRGRGVRAVHRDDHRASGVRGPGRGPSSHRDAGRSGRGLGGQPAGPASWPWWPARWPSASAPPFFDAAQEEIELRARLDFSRDRPGSSRPGWGRRSAGRGGGRGPPGPGRRGGGPGVAAER